jgi:hypothetical protein
MPAKLKLPLRLVFQAFAVSAALSGASCGDDTSGSDASVVDASTVDHEMFAGYCIEGTFPGIDGSLCPNGPVHRQEDCPPGCTFYG